MTARLPDAVTLFAALDATWPAAACNRCGPWLIRDGQGGGKRVSAATAAADWVPDDIASAEAAMRAFGHTPLFLLREGEQALDAALAARGYSVVDPVVIYAAPCATIATPSPAPLTAFAHWPPLAIAVELWATAGIGPARLAVMDRVPGPKTAILGRTADRASGAAFVAVHQTCAMLHALEVAPTLRRQGCANNILRLATCWAQDHGAATLSLVVTQANTGARALYASLGMKVMGQYHYRQK
ncbi:MAG: GNAT family N-acetyltransferase [Pseudorhodobacter sp.]|nr:GNAT family N-acetyltransferase [Pseudorhodobacter sp.]